MLPQLPFPVDFVPNIVPAPYHELHLETLILLIHNHLSLPIKSPLEVFHDVRHEDGVVVVSHGQEWELQLLVPEPVAAPSIFDHFLLFQLFL